MSTLALTELTTGTLDGAGVFDALMRANKVHLQNEFDKGRIRGPEYATVYLGALQSVMQTAVAYLLQSQKVTLEAQLIEQQIELIRQQRVNLLDDLTTNTAQRSKLASELTLLAQKTITEKAQVESAGVATDSVIGRQKAVYAGQAEGYIRDAEQKAAQIMVQTWNTRMLSDSDVTNYDSVNKIADVYVGGAVSKMLTGVGVAVP